MDNPQSEYNRLIQPIEDRMINSVWRITRNPDDADDAFQDALVKIWKQLEKIRMHPNPQALILRICANSAYDILRKKHRFRKIEEQYSTDFQDKPSLSDESILSSEIKTVVLSAISRLSRNQATAILMRYIQELPYGEIAGALGCEESTARKHIARAKVKLKKLLSPVLTAPREEVNNER